MIRIRSLVCATFVCSLLGGALLVDVAGCGAGKDNGSAGLGTNPGEQDGSSFDLGTGLGDVDSNVPCTGLKCQVVTCAGGGTTTITGTVYAPNGTLPLYNVIVYVPNSKVDPFPIGVHCDKCGSITSGNPITTALTNFQGKFILKDVPAGTDIPLVMQLGKWRRQITIPKVDACVDNHLTDAGLTRLPKNRTEGDMPHVAVTTGGCDKLSCMLPKVGIDANEFGVAGQDKAVVFYEGGGAFAGPGGPTGMKPARALWSDINELKKYDMAIFSCECTEDPSTKDVTSYGAVDEYLKAGGRIFTTDFQYTWYKFSPDPGLKSWGNIPGGAPTGSSPVDVDVSFPKGKALADWMHYVDPSSAYAKVTPDYVFDNFYSTNASAVQTWASSGPPTHPRFMTTNVPVGVPADSQCGKAVHLDAHINGTDRVDPSFPAGCMSKIKNGEEAFAFFFFDLASCIQDEGKDPKPPPPK